MKNRSAQMFHYIPDFEPQKYLTKILIFLYPDYVSFLRALADVTTEAFQFQSSDDESEILKNSNNRNVSQNRIKSFFLFYPHIYYLGGLFKSDLGDREEGVRETMNGNPTALDENLYLETNHSYEKISQNKYAFYKLGKINNVPTLSPSGTERKGKCA